MKFKKVSEANLMKQIVNLACHFMYSIGSKTYYIYIYTNVWSNLCTKSFAYFKFAKNKIKTDINILHTDPQILYPV